MFKRLISSNLIKSSGIYTVTSVVNSSIPFLLIPLLTRFLSPDEYGIIAMYMLTCTFISAFIGLNIQGAISRRYFDFKEQLEKLSLYIGNCFLILIVTSVVMIGVYFFLNDLIYANIGIRSYWLYSTIIVAVCQFIILVPLALWQVRAKPLQYGLFQIMMSLLNLGLTVVLVVYLEKGWHGRITAIVVSNMVFATISIIYLLRSKLLTFRFHKEYVLNAIKFGLPLVPHTLGGIIIALTDRVLIKNMISIEDTGIYTIAYQITSLISLLTVAFNAAFVPWLYAKLQENKEEEKRKIVQYTYGYFVLLAIIALVFVVVTPYALDYFIGNKYNGAKNYLGWLALGFVFNGMYLMVTNYIFYAERTSILMVTTFLSAIINVVLSYYLILLNGVVGACQASAVALFVMFILTWVMSNKAYKMPWSLVALKS